MKKKISLLVINPLAQITRAETQLAFLRCPISKVKSISIFNSDLSSSFYHQHYLKTCTSLVTWRHHWKFKGSPLSTANFTLIFCLFLKLPFPGHTYVFILLSFIEYIFKGMCYTIWNTVPTVCLHLKLYFNTTSENKGLKMNHDIFHSQLNS